MLYPEIEPYEHGLLDVGDGHRIYWETCGNPDGKPALVVHGGPGTGCSTNLRRYFDPDRYRVVLVDQRGCGRSTPHAGAPVADLSANTTDHLVADFQLLRTRLGIEKWLLFGGSWGCVLGLTYALRHTERVSEMVLMGLATDRFLEIEMLIRGLGAYFPDAFGKFRAGVPEGERDGDLSAAYHRLLMDPDPAVHRKAADGWCAWEDAMLPGVPPHKTFEDPAYRLCFARLVTHYFSNRAFLPDGEILRNLGKLGGIPAVLAQGVLDTSNIVGTPWLLHHAWPGSELVMLDDIGHSTQDAPMQDVLVGATDRFARRA
ncbi:prolyl aminopeptidase [Amycolatopsis australiensis]|uniref:Proline iminopeptidase n=1 Tax=Amycolatopsis australiensis TaxID=546364 RepID=A0A1K1SCE6_9PSEU|nr:prolyl aminopeptidase [Amycolatopsis australiensis]SFW81780.1 proline iminopeptidase [Amycolatopsis australiensis]